MNRRAAHLIRSERGSVLLMSSVAIVTLLMLSALVIDIANARQHSTQIQSAADAAALAAAQDLPNKGQAMQTAKDFASENYNIPHNAWSGCSDPEALSNTPDHATNNNRCISFNSDATLVRVKLPTQALALFFGGVVGRDTIDLSAVATAGSYAPATDRILPATVTASMGTGLLCLENSGNDTTCASRSSGNFGSIYSPRLNMFKPASNVLQTGEAINYAMNVDHNLLPWDGSTRTCDGKLVAPCDTTNQVGDGTANWLVVSTGNDVPPVTEGFVTGFTAETTDLGIVEFCGRLTRPDFTAVNALNPYPENCTPGQPTTTIAGTEINGRHIYHWMTEKARQLFYPEVVAENLPDDDPKLAVGSMIYQSGDARLICYLSGYRYDPITKTETTPNCSSTGLPGGTVTSTVDVADHFTEVSFGNNHGTYPFAGDWLESPEADGPKAGDVSVPGSGTLNMNLSSAPPEISRTVDLSAATHPSRVTNPVLALSWNHGLTEETSAAEIQISADGVKFDVLQSIDRTSPQSGSLKVDINAYASQTTTIRIVQTGPIKSAGQFLRLDPVRIGWQEKTAQPLGIGPLFRKEIRFDPRYGVVPRLSDWPSSGEKASPLEGFWSTFTYNIYSTSTKVKGFDGWVMDPALIETDPNADGMSYGFSPEPVIRLVD